MANELPLPAAVAEIDSQIQMLELMQQGLDGLTGIRNSLPEAIKVLDGVKTGLKGETISFKDLVKLEKDPGTGEVRVVTDTSKFEAYAEGKGDVVPDLVSEAVRAQKALEEVVKPFAKSQSDLLSAMEKLSSGLEKGSKAFEAVAKAIKNMERAWDLFDRAMEGEISADELIEAFDKYFSGMLDVFAKLIDKVPGLGPFLAQYAKAIHSIIPDLKSISAVTLAKNEVIANVFKSVPVMTPVEADAQTAVEQQSESIAQQIGALKEQRMSLLSDHEAELARLATLEVEQFWSTARLGAEREAGYTYERISEIGLENLTALTAWRIRVTHLEQTDPTSPEIETLKGKIAELGTKSNELWQIQAGMREEAISELEVLIRTNHHLLQRADLLELQNRFPELEPAINDIRVGNPMGTPKTSKSVPKVSTAPSEDTTVKVAVAAAGMSTRVKAGLAAGGAVLLVLGGFLFASSGDECPPGSALMAAGEGIHAVAEDPCPPEDDPLISAGNDTPVDDGSADTSKDDDVVSKGEEVDGDGDEDSKSDDELEPTPSLPPSLISAGLGLGGVGDALATMFDRPFALVSAGPRTDDAPNDLIFSIPGIPVTMYHSAADLYLLRRVRINLERGDHTDLLGNTVFECGLDDGEMVVVCPEGEPGILDEELALTFMVMAEPIARSEQEGEAIYAYVIDSDGQPENNWVANPSFAWDYYQGTDTWFELFHDFASGEWEMTVRTVNESQEIVESDQAVRAVIMGEVVLFIVPASSAPVDSPFRVSSFIHDGSYSQGVSGGDVPGADPTEPLLP